MKRLGIFGGTFDPIHTGHLRVAEEVQEKLHLEKILFIPSHLPPHKEERRVSDSEHRVRMASLAIEGHPCFEVSRIEVKRKGTSYTIITLQELKKIHPHSEFYLIMGIDQLIEIETWKDPQEIFSLSKVVVMNRPGFSERGLLEIQKLLLTMGIRDWKSKLLSLKVTPIPISSTMIRQRMSQGESIEGLVPKKVEEYIREKGLYTK